MICVFPRVSVCWPGMNGVVRVENMGVDVFISLEAGINGEFTFKSLDFRGVSFTRVENPLHFSQWVYLVCPRAFESVFSGTSLGLPPPFVVRFTCETEIIRDDFSLKCELVARIVESTCDGDGVGLAIRRFPLIFSGQAQKNATKHGVRGAETEKGRGNDYAIDPF